MCVCTYVRIWIYLFIYVCVRVHHCNTCCVCIFMHICRHVTNINLSMCQNVAQVHKIVCMYYIYVHTCTLNAHTTKHQYLASATPSQMDSFDSTKPVFSCIYACTCVYVCVYLYVCMCVHVCTSNNKTWRHQRMSGEREAPQQTPFYFWRANITRFVNMMAWNLSRNMTSKMFTKIMRHKFWLEHHVKLVFTAFELTVFVLYSTLTCGRHVTQGDQHSFKHVCKHYIKLVWKINFKTCVVTVVDSFHLCCRTCSAATATPALCIWNSPCICMRVCAYACVFTFMHARMHVCTYVHTCMHASEYAYAYMGLTCRAISNSSPSQRARRRCPLP